MSFLQKIFQNLSNDSFPDSSEEPRQPGASQGPGEEIEAGHEEALQAEHAVGVEEDWIETETVQFVDCCQDKLLINIESKQVKLKEINEMR